MKDIVMSKYQFKNIDQWFNSFLNIKCEGNERKSLDWVKYFLEIADAVSRKSKDPNTKVGCVAVDPKTCRILATGYNGFPPKVNESNERWERPLKYEFVVHAEANTIASASRFGISLEGAVLFVNLHPCIDCTKLIASAGISEIVYVDTGLDTNQTQEWHEKLKIAKQIFKESGIKLLAVTKIGDPL